MSPNQLEELARQIAQMSIAETMKWNLVWLALAVLCGAVGAFAGSYLRRRGETYAAKQDLEEVLRQLRLTTDATTRIKAEIEHADWRQRELVSIKRTKAEALLLAMQRAKQRLEETSKEVLFGDREELPSDFGEESTMLTVLYFPELGTDGLVFGAHCAFMSKRLLSFANLRMLCDSQGISVQPHRQSAIQEFLNLNKLLLEQAGHIERVIANRMAEISGAVPPYVPSQSPCSRVIESWGDTDEARAARADIATRPTT
jgi:hypothetical protein